MSDHFVLPLSSSPSRRRRRPSTTIAPGSSSSSSSGDNQPHGLVAVAASPSDGAAPIVKPSSSSAGALHPHHLLSFRQQQPHPHHHNHNHHLLHAPLRPQPPLPDSITLDALLLIRSRIPEHLPRIVLAPQLYALSADHPPSAVDRALAALALARSPIAAGGPPVPRPQPQPQQQVQDPLADPRWRKFRVCGDAGDDDLASPLPTTPSSFSSSSSSSSSSLSSSTVAPTSLLASTALSSSSSVRKRPAASGAGAAGVPNGPADFGYVAVRDWTMWLESASLSRIGGPSTGRGSLSSSSSSSTPAPPAKKRKIGDAPTEPPSAEWRLARTGSGSRTREIRADVYDRFRGFVLARPEAVHVSREALRAGAGVSDDEVSELVSSGFLSIKNAAELWLTVPRAGAYVHSLLKGRQEILNLLKRKRYAEHLRATVEQRKLRGCELPASLIVLELIGSGMVVVVDTPVGDMLRLTKKGDRRDLIDAFRW